jgi:hypothetical protein
LEPGDVGGPEEVDVDEVSLSEVVITVLCNVVLDKAALEAKALLGVQLGVVEEGQLQALLAEGDRIAKTLDSQALCHESIQICLIINSLYHLCSNYNLFTL